jgi:hypothetical protein
MLPNSLHRRILRPNEYRRLYFSTPFGPSPFRLRRRFLCLRLAHQSREFFTGVVVVIFLDCSFRSLLTLADIIRRK